MRLVEEAALSGQLSRGVLWALICSSFYNSISMSVHSPKTGFTVGCFEWPVFSLGLSYRYFCFKNVSGYMGEQTRSFFVLLWTAEYLLVFCVRADVAQNALKLKGIGSRFASREDVVLSRTAEVVCCLPKASWFLFGTLFMLAFISLFISVILCD